MSSTQTNNDLPVTEPNESNVAFSTEMSLIDALNLRCDHPGHDSSCANCIIRLEAELQLQAEIEASKYNEELDAEYQEELDERWEQEREEVERFLKGEIDANKFYGW